MSDSLTVFIGTANLGNAEPDKASLSAFVPYDGLISTVLPLHDSNTLNSDSSHLSLIVLGFQEATFEAEGSDTKRLHALLQAHLPSYQHFVTFQRGEMRLEVFASGVSAPHVRVLHVAAQNTGRAGLPNKGGILAELLVWKHIKLSFTTCHLEAHEGIHKYRVRCATMADILSGTRPPGEMHDTSITSHYCFVLGDLNFRTELPRHMYETEADHKLRVRTMVAEQQWQELSQYDELRRALRNKDCLAGFETPSCDFPPTFKVERKQGYQYIDKRRPSYTDRILYKTAHGLKDMIEPLLYEPIADFLSSDHKPVRGVFRLQPALKVTFPATPQDGRRPQRQSMLFHASFSSSIFSKQQSYGCIELLVSRIKCTLTSNATLLTQDENNSDAIDSPGDGKSGKSFLALNTSTSLTTPSPYIMFVASPEHCVQRKQHSGWGRLMRVCCGCHHGTSVELDGTKTRIAMGWPRTSIQKFTRVASWDNECVKIQIDTHLPNGEAIPLSGSLLKMTVMDGEGFRNQIKNPLIGTFALNMANLVIECIETHSIVKGRPASKPSRRLSSWVPFQNRASANEDKTGIPESTRLERKTSFRPTLAPSSSRRRMPGSHRGSVLNLFGLGGFDSNDPDSEMDIDEPLYKNGKEVGRIQCHVEARWLTK